MKGTSASTSAGAATTLDDFAASLVRRYFVRSGRLSRSAFWRSTLVAWGIFWVCFALLDDVTRIDLTRVPALVLLYSLFCLASRRYHDLDRSSSRLLLGLIPLFGLVFIMWELGFKRGTVGENGYGIDPRALIEKRDYATV